MQEALKPIWFLIKTAILLAIAAYPVTLVIQLLSIGNKPFSTYNHYIGYVFSNYWDWIFVAIITLFLIRPGDKILQYIDDIRKRHYELEFNRWIDTPYISPLHLYHLIAPPVALSKDARSQALHPFYKSIISDFRDRVYINAKYTQIDPDSKPTVIKIVGKSLLIQLLVNTLMFFLSVAGILYTNTLSNPINAWAKVFIPVGAYFLFQNFIIIKAIKLENPKHTYAQLTKHFDMEEPKVTWRDLFPDRPYGESILFAWRADCERRQRLAYEASNRPVPVRMEYKSPGLPPKPFPADELPHWATAAEQSYYEEISEHTQRVVDRNKKIADDSKGKVVVFQKRK